MFSIFFRKLLDKERENNFFTLIRPSDRVRKKNGKLCRNFWQYYVEESDDYAEKMPDYAEISKIN